jgi:hypothetical protein
MSSEAPNGEILITAAGADHLEQNSGVRQRILRLAAASAAASDSAAYHRIASGSSLITRCPSM